MLDNKKLISAYVAAPLIVFGSVACPVFAATILDTAMFDGKTLALVGGNSGGSGINYTDAEAFAESINSFVVTVESEAMNQFIYDTWGAAQFGTHPAVDSLIIGFTDFASEGNFVWHDGSDPNGYAKWAPGEPNNTFGNEHVGTIIGFKDGANGPPNPNNPFFGPPWWNDIPNVAGNFETPQRPFYAVLELIPEPSTAVLCLLAVSFLMPRRY